MRPRPHRPTALLLGWLFERLYRELAPAYDFVSWLVSGGRWRRWQRVALPLLIGPRVLEVGPGPGHLLSEMLDQGCDAFGLDNSLAMVRLARRRLVARDRRSRLVRGDARAMPFGQATFDSLVLTFPPPFVREDAFWSEAARILRPGGRLVIVEGAESSSRIWPRLLERLLGSLAGPSAEAPAEFAAGPLVARRATLTTRDGKVWLILAESKG